MSYTKLRDGQPVDFPDGDTEPGFVTTLAEKKRRWYIYLISCGALSLLLGLSVGAYVHRHLHKAQSGMEWAPHATSSNCHHPVIRREWRSLSVEEKDDYLDAVRCLRDIPSRIGQSQSLYDDFPWIHYRIGDYSHHAAAFLAWHRTFIDTYERALRKDCGYRGYLVYWDWTLDWQDLTKAPIWSSTHGFGGNGNSSMGEAIVHGHCITDGTFANIEIPYIDDEYHPHCLSRGFLHGESLRELGQWFRPSAIDGLMERDDYEEFLLGLEDGPHIAIPRSIRGDFSMLTAPSDPVFFLHHTQLDRLWWIWQQRDVSRRLWQYHGASEHNSTVQATLDDLLPLGGLGEDVTARQVMSTESDLLCYRY